MAQPERKPPIWGKRSGQSLHRQFFSAVFHLSHPLLSTSRKPSPLAFQVPTTVAAERAAKPHARPASRTAGFTFPGRLYVGPPSKKAELPSPAPSCAAARSCLFNLHVAPYAEGKPGFRPSRPAANSHVTVAVAQPNCGCRNELPPARLDCFFPGHHS